MAVISDTHLPAAGPDLPPGAIELIESAAHLLHAGDVINPASLFDLRVLAGGSMTIVDAPGTDQPPTSCIAASNPRNPYPKATAAGIVPRARARGPERSCT